VSTPSDADVDSLIARLAGPLPPDARQASRRAAEAALGQLVCPGEGAAYRALVPLQRAYFDPPDDHRAAWDIGQERTRTSKLINQPPLEHGRDLPVTRRWKLGG
jgi:hypothetical protein